MTLEFIYPFIHLSWNAHPSIFPMWCRGHRKFMAPHWEKSKIYQPHSKFDILQWIWGNSTGAIVSNCKNIWINLRQVSKATTHGQHAQILLPHFMHLKQFECFLFWPSDSCQLQEFNCWVCKGILHHWHSHHPKSTCSLHSHHWAEFLELDKKKHGMFQEL